MLLNISFYFCIIINYLHNFRTLVQWYDSLGQGTQLRELEREYRLLCTASADALLDEDFKLS